MARIGIGKRRRFLVLERDGFRCRYCGHAGELHVDHVVPVSRGGTNAIDNLVTACEPCNIGKGAMLIRLEPPARRRDHAAGERDAYIAAVGRSWGKTLPRGWESVVARFYDLGVGLLAVEESIEDTCAVYGDWNALCRRLVHRCETRNLYASPPFVRWFEEEWCG